jgi:hypothetical protein
LIRALSLGAVALSLSLPLLGSAQAAPPAPRGPHPRLFLSPPTLAALKKNNHQAKSWAAAAVERCRDVAQNPDRYKQSGYQGADWSVAAASCGLAFQITRDPKMAAAGLKLWRALLEDVDTIGDKKACAPGSPPENATHAIWRDTGYAIRFIGPHAALAYDWLHDAPGADEALRKESRGCFAAWLAWYDKDGYLRTTPGANYHAGYVLAKALIAVATAGEDPAGDRAFAETIDELFGKQIIGQGLAGESGSVGQPAGALVGGDWPEGWQYGALSVLEYGLAARALEENGAPLPAMHRWADDVVVRALHGLAPTGDRAYVGGDTGIETYSLPRNPSTLQVGLLGPASERAAAWASFAIGKNPPHKEASPALEALAEARTVTPQDYRASAPPTWFVARGTRNLYARSDWKDGAAWAVFTSAPRLVPDHQHPDATNFVFSRGADDLIVDTSPYGVRTTMTSNALTVDSGNVGGDYRPSQTPWSEAELRWARATKSGIVAARGDFHGAYRVQEIPSDIPFAQRDWVFLPEGEIVTVDRVDTGNPTRKLYLRFRTPAHLTMSADHKTAAGTVGKSTVAIHIAALSAGAPVLRVPAVRDCEGVPFGSCNRSRARIDEYAVELPGPVASAVHVIDGIKREDAAASVKVERPNGLLGVTVKRAGLTPVTVMTSGQSSSRTPSTFSYPVDARDGTRHVVYDAPEDDHGRSTVKASARGGQCLIEIAAGGGFVGRPLIFSVAPAAAGCAVVEDPDAPAARP